MMSDIPGYSARTEEGVTFEAVAIMDGGMPRVGFRVTHNDGCLEYITLLPSSRTGEGKDSSNVFLYHSDDDTDTLGTAVTHRSFDPHTTSHVKMRVVYISQETANEEPRPLILGDTETIYAVLKSERWTEGLATVFVTPDGIGRMFYDTIEEAREEHE